MMVPWKLQIEQSLRNESGLEAVEYAVITGLIVVAALTAMVILGQWVSGTYTTTHSRLGVGGP